MRKRLQRQWRLFLAGYWSGRGYDDMMWWPLTWWQRAITHVLYPPEWRAPDPRLVAAIVDRVTFNAHIIETGTKSYRLRTSKTNHRGAGSPQQGPS